MLIIQILIAAFSVFAIERTVRQYRQGRLPRVLFAFWILFWFVAAVVAVLPQTTQFAADIAGVGRGADLVIYLSLIALFYLAFRLYVKIEESERQITRLVRKLALEDLDKEVDSRQ
jgi:hypothetical protein